MRKTAFILSVFFLFCFLTSCAGEAKDVDLTAVMAEVDSKIDMAEMVDIKDTAALKKYYKVDPADVESFAAKYSKSSTEYLEVIMVRAVDSEAAKRVSEKLGQVFGRKKNEAASYSAEQLKVLKQCEVKIKGDYVTMFLGKDAKKMTEIFDGYFK